MNEPNAKRCHVCGKDVSSGWFARIRHGEEWILLCSPACAMRYYDSVRPEQETRAQELAANEHPLQFLVNGELWEREWACRFTGVAGLPPNRCPRRAIGDGRS